MRVVDWRPIRNLIVAGICIIAVSITYQHFRNVENKAFQWETSPCGTKMYAGYYFLGIKTSGNPNLEDYIDDGKRVWKKTITLFPESPDPKPPEVKWEMVMERTLQSCAEWKKKTGIEFPQ